MSFDQSTIVAVAKPVWQAGQLFLSWTSTAPAGTWHQVYVARRLAWYGRSTDCAIPTPSASRARIDVGAVADGEQQTDFSASLPAAPDDRVRLTWLGGSFEGDDLQSFRVYGEKTPGAGIDYSTPLAEVAAYPGGLVLDGWGAGGWGDGGWGDAAGAYQWTSGPLGSGTWSFAIRPVDSAGNEGPSVVGAVVVLVPPLPPALRPDHTRLAYAYDPATKTAALQWLASPSLS